MYSCRTLACLGKRIVLCAAMGLPTVTALQANGPWTSNGPDGRSIRAVVVDPASNSTVYAGSEGGGVFKSLDGGVTWRAINNGDLPSLFVRDLILDPSDGSMLYAGTSSGVAKSTDGGNNWVRMNNGLGNTRVLISGDRSQ